MMTAGGHGDCVAPFVADVGLWGYELLIVYPYGTV
jgi:hypothetical protein